MKETRLVVARHGETPANVAMLMQGSGDDSLTEKGRQQAQALARRLADEFGDAVALYSSPLGRALQTARAISAALNDLPVWSHPDLVEYDLGEWDGLPYMVLRDKHRLWERMRADPDFTPPGGETPQGFARRVHTTFEEIIRAHPGQTVIVVSHGGVISTALALLIENDGSVWRKYQLFNCAFAEVLLGEGPHLIRLNEASHLNDIGIFTWPG